MEWTLCILARSFRFLVAIVRVVFNLQKRWGMTDVRGCPSREIR